MFRRYSPLKNFIPKTFVCVHVVVLQHSQSIRITSSAVSLPNQGPVVQSVISLTSSLRIILLTVLADSIYNILIFFAEKM